MCYFNSEGVAEFLTSDELRIFSAAEAWEMMGSRVYRTIGDRQYSVIWHNSSKLHFDVLLAHVKHPEKQWSMKDRTVGDKIVTFGECVVAAANEGFQMFRFLNRLSQFDIHGTEKEERVARRGFDKLIRDFDIQILVKHGICPVTFLPAGESPNKYCENILKAIENKVIENPLPLFKALGRSFDLIDPEEYKGRWFYCLQRDFMRFLPLLDMNKTRKKLKEMKFDGKEPTIPDLIEQSLEYVHREEILYRDLDYLFARDLLPDSMIARIAFPPSEAFHVDYRQKPRGSPLFMCFDLENNSRLKKLRWVWRYRETDGRSLREITLSDHYHQIILENTPREVFDLPMILELLKYFKKNNEIKRILLEKIPHYNEILFYMIECGTVQIPTPDY